FFSSSSGFFGSLGSPMPTSSITRRLNCHLSLRMSRPYHTLDFDLKSGQLILAATVGSGGDGSEARGSNLRPSQSRTTIQRVHGHPSRRSGGVPPMGRSSEPV